MNILISLAEPKIDTEVGIDLFGLIPRRPAKSSSHEWRKLPLPLLENQIVKAVLGSSTSHTSRVVQVDEPSHAWDYRQV